MTRHLWQGRRETRLREQEGELEKNHVATRHSPLCVSLH
jgi:hypothetical protein